jgi:aminopeptidase N
VTAAPHQQRHSVYQLSDYKKPSFLMRSVVLDFDLYPLKTRVYSKMEIYRTEYADDNDPLCLNGESLILLSVKIDGRVLTDEKYQLTDQMLTLSAVPNEFTLETEVEISPEKNKSLNGLYISNDNYCTQCESKGFRRITYFLDRPDVMTQFEVNITADKKEYPILLSNGDLISTQDLDNGKHRVTWRDSSKKPCYLFALVAGIFDVLTDQYKTCSGKIVDLFLYVEKGYKDQAGYALASLKHAMEWDEKKFGREYDLKRYTIVAVSDFNSGAMENKALNIFNTKYILAKPETATDDDYVSIEDVIGHEYFHNWTGNRITCRDWCQLTLKEGLTVLRDQLFTEDRTTPLLGRMRSAKIILDRQFLEDSGPTAHAIRPDHYMAVDNLYTTTIYYKGSEVIRMLRTWFGIDGFRRGMDLYFERHDGQAVTTDDFVAALADANGRDLTQFKRWYTQRGTPRVNVTDAYDARKQEYTLTIKQLPPEICGKPLDESRPFTFPMAMGLLNREGEVVQVNLPSLNIYDQSSCTLEINDSQQEFVFTGVSSHPVPSLLRHFSAPVKLHYQYTDEDLALLTQHDTDQFNRWFVSRQWMARIIFQIADNELNMSESLQRQITLLTTVFISLFNNSVVDEYLLSQILMLPTPAYLVQSSQPGFNPQKMIKAYLLLKKHLGTALKEHWLARYESLKTNESYVYNVKAMSKRALKMCV